MTPFQRRIHDILVPKLAELGIRERAAACFIAQIDVETAGGTSRNVRLRHNFAGIRGAKRTISNTRGYITYPNDAAGIDAYLRLLQRRYSGVLAVARETNDPYKTAVELGRSPWAATHYRIGADGTNDRDGDAGKILGRKGTEGQALWPRITRILN